MLKPLLLVSAIALAAPVLAQTTSSSTSMDNQTTSSSTSSTNDDAGAMSGNTVNAQKTTGTADEADDSTTDHSMMGHSATDTRAATSGTMDTSMASAGQTVQPGNENPEHDARGIAVLSDPAFVPAGWNGSAGSAMGGPVDTSDSYPACSRTVTDNCTQTYERHHG